jgi:hypothetical protein
MSSHKIIFGHIYPHYFIDYRLKYALLLSISHAQITGSKKRRPKNLMEEEHETNEERLDSLMFIFMSKEGISAFNKR